MFLVCPSSSYSFFLIPPSCLLRTLFAVLFICCFPPTSVFLFPPVHCFFFSSKDWMCNWSSWWLLLCSALGNKCAALKSWLVFDCISISFLSLLLMSLFNCIFTLVGKASILLSLWNNMAIKDKVPLLVALCQSPFWSQVSFLSAATVRSIPGNRVVDLLTVDLSPCLEHLPRSHQGL